MDNRRCVIDIGTNSTRLMFAHIENGRVFCEQKMLRTVRTGEGVNASGELCEAAIERTVGALREYREIIDGRAPQAQVMCFATSAVRDAKNSGEFCRIVKECTGFEVRILSGDEEARCGYAGAVGGGDGGIIDVGGGSTEVIFGHRGDIVFAKSFQVGCVRTLEMFPDDEPAAMLYAARMFSELALPQSIDVPFYAIGGTATALAAMDQKLLEYDPRRVTGYILRRERMEKMFCEISGLEFAERMQLAGLTEKRADVIVYGLAILLAFMRTYDIAQVSASDADNMEGAALLWDEL